MPHRKVQRLLFLFDAASGAWSAFLDSAKKVLRVNGCSLCQVTHGVATEKQEWRECKDALGVPVEYMHRDEIPESLEELVQGRLPCVVAETASGPEVLLDREVIGRCKGSVEDLRGKLLFHAARHQLSL